MVFLHFFRLLQSSVSKSKGVKKQNINKYFYGNNAVILQLGQFFKKGDLGGVCKS